MVKGPGTALIIFHLPPTIHRASELRCYFGLQFLVIGCHNSFYPPQSLLIETLHNSLVNSSTVEITWLSRSSRWTIDLRPMFGGS